MTRNILTVGWLIAVWLALWGSFTVANVLGGVIVSILALRLIPVRARTNKLGIRPVAVLRLLAVFAWALTKASAEVAWEIITPRDTTRPAVISVPLSTTVSGIVATVANLVSLTPGTLTIDVDSLSSTLFVHTLHFRSEASTRADVHRFEELATAAFPPRRQHS